MPNLHKFSYLKSSNVDYIEEIFERYLKDPASVDESWRYFFEGMELGDEIAEGERQASVQAATATEVSPGQTAIAKAVNGAAAQPSSTLSARAVDLSAEAKVADLINAYREYGRLIADIDPLTPPPSSHPFLELSRFGLTEADLAKTFTAGNLIGLGPAPLNEIIARLKKTYCNRIAVEFTHIQIPEARRWLQERMESTGNEDPSLDHETRKWILKRLTRTETFERFLHTRYVAQKRFSIEGGDATIPLLDCMIEKGADLGATDFVLGMAHRGRLNVLTHIFQKKYEHIFTEFEGEYKHDETMGEGDVKYHKGYSADFTTRKDKKVHLSLMPNPSHLEFVNPVVEGAVRAKQEKRRDKEQSQVVPVLIHGDAAFAGQGICYETLNMSQLEGYKTGGTFHIVINNQVGFTADPNETRSTTYSTDLAKTLDAAPVFHVNGDDPEAVWYATKLCMEYRQKFHRDVFVDLICYRKHGHNESDEPAFTQPVLYKKIKAHSSPREIYAKALQDSGVVSAEEAQAMIQEITEVLTEAQKRTREEHPQPYLSVFEGAWKGLKQPKATDLFSPVKTSVSQEVLREISERLNSTPEGFKIHPKLLRLLEGRKKSIDEGQGIDWGSAEALAFGSLLIEGHPVRLSGQDSERGTFSHRQSVLHDYESGEEYTPLNHIRKDQAPYNVYNSHLSESGVMGFEYGYSLADPHSLVIWEAQFGDFANGAQVIIDQFIISSESKWQRMSGLVLLLPHGYEGQGPEHSSARIERFIGLAGKNNIVLCNLTTPAQFFHVLRRQMKRDFRKPLVIMTPKSLLRHPKAVSTLDELSSDSFLEVLDDSLMNSSEAAIKVRRVLICSGKVYYDLLAKREELALHSVALVRLEQLYPWPAQRLADVLRRYPNAKDLVWVQEEPKNMGAWIFVFNQWMGGYAHFREEVDGRTIRYIGRDIGAAPAVGSHKIHDSDQRALVEKAFADL